MADYYASQIVADWSGVTNQMRIEYCMRIPPFLRAKTRRSYWS